MAGQPQNRPPHVRPTPEVEVLGHVDLFEDVHKPLLLCWALNLVVEGHGYDVRVLAVVQIVSAEQRDDRALANQDHVPSRRKSNKSCTPLLVNVDASRRP
jgi:hypothetical protein